MTKEKINLIFRIIQWFTFHPWLKLIALALAIVVWFYVKGEIGKFNY